MYIKVFCNFLLNFELNYSWDIDIAIKHEKTRLMMLKLKNDFIKKLRIKCNWNQYFPRETSDYQQIRKIGVSTIKWAKTQNN